MSRAGRREASPKRAGHAFSDAARRRAARRRRKLPPPFSLRLTAAERAQLEAAAGGRPLGTFIKSKLFDGELKPAPRRKPVKDQAELAQLLGMLGQMRLANNLNQLAKSANMGALPLSPEVEAELVEACAAVLAMKAMLMRALGYTSESAP